MYGCKLYLCLEFALLLYITLPQPSAAEVNLLTNYLPASMQALAYYIDLLQYEPLSTTTAEPPFIANDEDFNNLPTTSTTTTRTPVTTTTSSTTTRRPTIIFNNNNTFGWWQPPSWWHQSSTTTTTRRPQAPPTPPHRPGIFAPPHSPHIKRQPEKLEGYELFDEIGENPEGFEDLPLSLIRDIQTEIEHDEFTNDVESLDNFLRLYDDNYGRATFDPETAMDRWSSTSTAGKKRVPPTKPYVEFLLVYDLLKRDAKAANLSKYEGYSAKMLAELQELSKFSAEHQLYTLFKRMLERSDIERSDVVSRIQSILKDLGNPESVTAKALRYIPALQFVP